MTRGLCSTSLLADSQHSLHLGGRQNDHIDVEMSNESGDVLGHDIGLCFLEGNNCFLLCLRLLESFRGIRTPHETNPETSEYYRAFTGRLKPFR